MTHKILSLFEYSKGYHMGANPSDSLNLEDSVIDALVDLVGSEEDVERAAEESFNDLAESFEKNEVEMSEDMIPEKLALAALVLKLVELGSLGPEEADSFIEEYID